MCQYYSMLPGSSGLRLRPGPPGRRARPRRVTAQLSRLWHNHAHASSRPLSPSILIKSDSESAHPSPTSDEPRTRNQLEVELEIRRARPPGPGAQHVHLGLQVTNSSWTGPSVLNLNSDAVSSSESISRRPSSSAACRFLSQVPKDECIGWYW